MNSFIKRRVLAGSSWVEFPRWRVRGSSLTPRVVPGPHGAGSVGRPSIWIRPLAGRVSRAARRGARPSEIIHEPERSRKGQRRECGPGTLDGGDTVVDCSTARARRYLYG